MSRSPSPGSSLNIFDAVQANKRRTNVLFGVFIALVAGVTLLIGIALGLPIAVAAVTMGAFTVIALLVSIWVYRSADSLVLGVSEAREVQRKDYPELFRVIENLCIGSGLPMPKVYVIEDSAPNAFATGRDPKHASVAITSGLLKKLDKLELEGVMAHELSHVGNFDTRLMIMTAVLVGFIALMVDVFLRATWFGAGRRSRYKGEGEGPLQAVLLVLVIVGIILAPIVARLIQLALSRQREYLADASGALLTRYPEGLARALEKLEKDQDPLEVATKATAHLYIVNPLKGHESALNNMYSTHPPIEERVKRLRAMSLPAAPPPAAR